MPYFQIAAPGTNAGPCLDEQCGHIDCDKTRAMAEGACTICTEPITYDRLIVFSKDGSVDHRACYLEMLEEV